MTRSLQLTRRDILRSGTAAAALGTVASADSALARNRHVPQDIFVSSKDVPLLQLPEGLTAFADHVFVGTYNYLTPGKSRIFVFDANTGDLEATIGDKPGQELVSAGALLGLSIHPHTHDLFANANQAGNILRIRHVMSDKPAISVYSTFPTGTAEPPGPEDMARHRNGWLYASDSNNRRLYAVPPGGGNPKVMVGPPGSDAMFSDHGLFAQPEAGFAPNGLGPVSS